MWSTQRPDWMTAEIAVALDLIDALADGGAITPEQQDELGNFQDDGIAIETALAIADRERVILPIEPLTVAHRLFTSQRELFSPATNFDKVSALITAKLAEARSFAAS